MTIRKINKSDFEKCSLFIRDVIKNSKATPKMKEFIKKRYSPFGIQRLFKTSEMFIIKYNDKIICTGKLSKNTNEIGMIYVNPNFQRKKNGTKMMQFLESLAKKKKKKETYVHALYPAIGFYKKLGYKLIKCKGNNMKLVYNENHRFSSIQISIMRKQK